MLSPQKVVGLTLRKLGDKEESEIVLAYEECSILTLANTYGVSRQTITRILKDHSVTLRPQGRPKL